jgi:hypothetical protein
VRDAGGARPGRPIPRRHLPPARPGGERPAASRYWRIARDAPVVVSSEDKRRSLLTACAAVVAAALFASISYRIGLGVDVQDEGFAVVIPWRWAVGDSPFVDEMNLLQTAGFLTYPFVKAYVWATGGSDGIVLYLRQLYVLWVLIVSGFAFNAVRGLVRWQYGVTIATVYATFAVLGSTQLTYATLAAGFLTIGVALGVRVVLGAEERGGAADEDGRRRRLLALGAGVAHGLAAVASPTLALIVPIYATCLALAMGQGLVGWLSASIRAPLQALPSLAREWDWRRAQMRERAGEPGRDVRGGGDDATAVADAAEVEADDGRAGPAGSAVDTTAGDVWGAGSEARRGGGDAHAAWLVVSAYAAGAALVILVAALVALSFGWSNLTRDWRYQMSVAYALDQLGGAGKGWRLLGDLGAVFWSIPISLLVAATLVWLRRRRLRLARVLLMLAPIGLYFAGRRAEVETSAFAIVATGLSLYLFVFVQPRFAERAARLLLWIVVPSILAGAWISFTAVSGIITGAVGLTPVFIAAGLYLVWSAGPEEPEGAGLLDRQRWWLVMLSLMAVMGVTIAFMFQYLPRDVPYSTYRVRVADGPYAGLLVGENDARTLADLRRDLARHAAPGDRLMVFYESPGYYLFWPHRIATNSVRLASDQEDGLLPRSTRAWFRRNSSVPDVIVRAFEPRGRSDEVVARRFSGGLRGYEVVARREDYVILRRTPGWTDAEVLNALPE